MVYFNVPDSEYLDYVQSNKKHGKDKEKVKLKMENGDVIETMEGDFENKAVDIAFLAAFHNPNQVFRHDQTPASS